MNRFLVQVLEEKRRELEKKRGKTFDDAPPARDFLGALSKKGAIIAEIKKRSPSVSRFLYDGPPEALARVYLENGASAISIVTDEKNFGTSLRDVAMVKEAVPLPVLVKEFIIDELQVREARAAGADAVLLIARILEREKLDALLDLVHGLGFEALVECHDENDIEKAREAKIIGINNRNLDTLETSLETTRRLLPVIPGGAVRVAESGINDRSDVEDLLALGADAFLVGGALLNAPDAGAKLKELTDA
jgi:indole-3-glycerol phosphate synthase